MKVCLRSLSSFLAMLMFTTTTLFSQITITKAEMDAWFNNAMYTWWYTTPSGSTLANVDLGSDSASLQNFDFSNIAIQSGHTWDSLTRYMVPPVGLYRADLFPLATICIKTINPALLIYAAVNYDGFYQLGKISPPDTTTMASYSPARLMWPLPLQMNAVMTSVDTLRTTDGTINASTRAFSVSGFGNVKYPDGITRSSLRVVEDDITIRTFLGNFVSRTRSKILGFWSEDGCEMTFTVDTAFVSGATNITYFEFSKKTGTTGVASQPNTLPTHFSLYQNYPNPFNPSTNISFSLPSKTFVSLKVYDLLGREITTVVADNLPAGNYSREWNALGMTSGIYFYRLQAGSYSETKKLVLMR